MINTKKGDVTFGMLLFASALVLFACWVIFFFVFIPLIDKSKEQVIVQKSKDSQYSLLLLNILRTPYKEGNVADLVAESYIERNYAELHSQMILIMRKNYGGKIGWDFKINSQSVSKQTDETPFFITSLDLLIPLPDSTPIAITMGVYGQKP